jgi:hypothetical protein
MARRAPPIPVLRVDEAGVPELVNAHLNLDRQVMDALRKNKAPVVPA